MAKIRVHALAKELNLASADILFSANQLGIKVKTASSGLTEEEVEILKLELLSENEDEIINNIKTKESITESQDKKENTSTKKEVEDKSKEIEIIEIEEKSSPAEISKLINKESTKIVEDLLSLGILSSIQAPLKNQDLDKLLESYG